MDSNPFLATLFTKYVRAAPIRAAYSENEEIVALRNSNNSIREDYDKLHKMYGAAVEEAERAKNDSKIQASKGAAAYSELEDLYKQTKDQLEKATEDKENVSKEVDKLQTSLNLTVDALKNSQTDKADMEVNSRVGLCIRMTC